MIGAIIGDIAGSRFEGYNNKTYDFELFTNKCVFTDDTLMSLAIAKALMESKEDYSDLEENSIKYMVELGLKYQLSRFGGNFFKWLKSEEHKPYGSYGNGAAMRVSACAYFAKSLEDAINYSTIVTNVSHNHEESVKAANVISACIFLARHKKSKEEIKEYVEKTYRKLDFTIDEIRDSYKFDVSCQGSVPQALEAFFESKDFEDAIRLAISIGGDSDTIGAITGSIAAAYYEVPEQIKQQALSYLTDDLLKIYNDFESIIGE